MSSKLRRNAHLLAVLATLLLVGTIGLLSWFQFNNARQARLWVRHTDQVITAGDELGFAVRDAESGQRGYLLTDQADYLTPYRDALGRIAVLQDELLRLTADNPSQQARLRELAPLLQRKLDELAQTVALRRDVGFDAALAVVRTDLGLHLTGRRRAAHRQAVPAAASGAQGGRDARPASRRVAHRQQQDRGSRCPGPRAGRIMPGERHDGASIITA